MNDLKILEELGQILNLKIKRGRRTLSFHSPTFVANEKDKVISISFSGCSISNLNIIVPYLLKLDFLRELNLANNGITDITPLKKLQNLTSLTLLSNKISDVSILSGLLELRFLNIGNNEINNVLPLKKLAKLKTLWLIGNQVSDFKELESLKLISLSLGNNNLKDISFLKNFLSLETLHLQDNEIENLEPLRNLIRLENLNLQSNKIQILDGLEDLTKVRTIELQNNPIKELPVWITSLFGKIQWQEYSNEVPGIFLYENPITSPPLEIVKQGKWAIKRYFEKIDNEGVDFIYEAKLTLVGEGGAGKTSLKKRLISPTASLPRKDNRTRGIEIKDWRLIHNENHIAHIWDFGGQDVYYPVHRFFLTQNSVFVLLASTRQTTHNFEYWIPTIYQFGGNSPIILGQTCDKGSKVSWSDLGFYLSNSHFNIVKTQMLPYFEIDLLNNNEGLESIKETIINQIKSLPHYGKGVPKSWVLIRNYLFKESKKESIISFVSFKNICINSSPKSFNNEEDFIDCCQFLHDIGVVLWYSSEDELKNWVILQPQWAMTAVYKIIDDRQIQLQRGIILSEDFNRLWNEDGYKEKHNVLRKMLEVFKIAFPKKHLREDYIMPVRLLTIPLEERWEHDNPLLRLEYRFEFMPRGIVNQLSAELSKYISNDEKVWNNAVNLSYRNNAKAQIEEHFHSRKITIKAAGKDARGLIILITETLDEIIESYKGVESEIYVPCICPECIKSPKPTSFLYGDLLRWGLNNEDEIVYCNEGRKALKIDELLHNVGLSSNESTNDQILAPSTLTIFLASSSELKGDREQFEIFINRENKYLIKKGIFLNLEIWEDFIDSMSKTRLQDEYNKVIKESDIFISLFFTKVGMFTSEEFDIAFGSFKETGRPFVYTYFKNGNVNISDIERSDLESKEIFESKLKLLGHFKTNYNNIDDLKYQFKKQLDKILDLK